MDMSMPGSGWGGGDELWGPKLQAAIDAGEVEQSRLEDMGRRILAGWYLLGQDGGYPPVNIQANVQANHAENVRACARDGTVLLKNEDAILPLKAPGSIAVIGSSSIQNPNGINSCVDQGCNEGALGMGWGSGAVEYPYLVAPLDAIKVQAAADGTDIVSSTTDDTAAGARAATGADVALVFITANSGEGYLTVEGNVGDRNNLDPWNDGNELVAAVAAVSDNVVVIVHSTGAVILEKILALPSVKAVVWGGLPSQENGNAVVDIVWGSTNPNGKLPYTIAKSENDYSSKVIRNGGDDNFSEGLYVDYRHFDAQNIEPRFEFGFGLSYTKYEYSNIAVTSVAIGGPAVGETGPGGRIDLFDDVAEVTATITNTGEVAGAEFGEDGDRGIMSTIGGGAAGGFIGKKIMGGKLGAMAGAVVGSIVANKVEDRFSSKNSHKQSHHQQQHHGGHHGSQYPQQNQYNQGYGAPYQSHHGSSSSGGLMGSVQNLLGKR
ncbi:hypothetical protein BN1723_005175 [Verticillium longisporum]|uniref:beta-glucosidase n=1 Tax=Verticillium longisporum TaxID=100787 RepID=A0A0G4N625_VERLO|nr:hypothetical protein BN1723_005175 [Verticillium longisporum]